MGLPSAWEACDRSDCCVDCHHGEPHVFPAGVVEEQSTWREKRPEHCVFEDPVVR